MSEQKWKLVPVEPTEEMVEYVRSFAGGQGYSLARGTEAIDTWKEMLAAAPVPPALDGEPERFDIEQIKGGAWRYKASHNGAIVMHADHRAHVAQLQAEIGSERKLRRECAARIHELSDESKDLKAEVERLRGALKFYADREHYHVESGNWDTVSGEPQNILWNGEEPDFIEDGTFARKALAEGKQHE